MLPSVPSSTVIAANFVSYSVYIRIYALDTPCNPHTKKLYSVINTIYVNNWCVYVKII